VGARAAPVERIGASVAGEPVRVAIDLETTGLASDQDAIIEIGAVKFAGAEVLGTYEQLVAPSQPLPYRVQRLTSIRPADLTGAPAIVDVTADLRAFLGDAALVGHSVQFDAAFLRRIGLARRNPLVDTYELASALLPNLANYTLESVGVALGVASPTYHRALADAQLARQVFLVLLERLRALDAATLRALGQLTNGHDWTPAYYVQAALRAHGSPAPAGGASSLGNLLSAKLEMAPEVLGMAVARAAPPPARAVANGALPAEASLEDQWQPIRALVANRCDAGGTALIEMDAAPASIIACLEPLLAWGARTGRAVTVVAADTPAAARLAREHIPNALAQLGIAPDALPIAEVVEPASYLCLHRWLGAATMPPAARPPRDLVRGLSKLAVWAQGTTTGRRGDVALSGAEAAAWQRARAGDEFADSSSECAYRKHGYCFIARAEAQSRAASIIATTHGALAEALAGRPHLLPDLDRVLVLDAHALEDALRQATGWTWDHAGTLAVLADLAESAPGGARVGLLHQLAARDQSAPEAAWFTQVAKTRTTITGFFAALALLYHDDEHDKLERPPRGAEAAERTLRLDERARRRGAWRDATDAWSALRGRLTALEQLLGEVVRRYPLTGDKRHALAADAIATELLGVKRSLERLRVEVGAALEPRTDAMLYWLRLPYNNVGPRADAGAVPERASSETPALCASRVEVASLLEPLTDPARALILTGAALAAGGDFEYLAGSLGLAQRDLATYRTPNDRARQTIFLVPEDAAEPNQQSYQRALEQALIALGKRLGGRVVAIFPSHTALRATWQGIRQALEREDVLVMAQGQDGSVRQLWDTFRTQPRVMLLGAGGFWDGAERAGAAPKCVFVARLPMPSLSDPLLAARADAWQDSQQQFVVPHAALRLRQALNGLAWSHDRRNAVVLFDRRIVTRDYGHTLLATLPACDLRQEPLVHLADAVAAWVDEPTREA
jgi:DNA polymerase III epsilon subunit family exonuclease